jgi:hypothetical protein
MNTSISAKDEQLNQIMKRISVIDLISHHANLLAINATIEVLHASELLNAFEKVVGSNLLIQACILAELLKYDTEFPNYDEGKFAELYGIEEFYITDGVGVIQYSNFPEKKGQFINSTEFLKILDDPNLNMGLPSTQSAFSQKQYKTIAIGRRDRLGIIQLGSNYIGASGQTAISGFGAVTEEAKRLSDVIASISSRMLNETQSIMASNDDSKTVQKFISTLRGDISSLTSLARQINLLGINAAIEAAHSTNEKQDFDNLLNIYMITEAKLAALVVDKKPGITCEDMQGVAACSGIGEFWITDEKGVVELTNIPGGKGFTFTNEGQTAPYMKILENPSLVVTAPPARRALDNLVYKFAAVARRDKKGIFQIGIPSQLYGDSTNKGFAEVANQIKALAEHLRGVINELDELLKGITAHH